MKKADVETYGGHPSVNVKVHDFYRWADHVAAVRDADCPGDAFTEEWITEHVSDEEMDRIFWEACEWETEYVTDYAQELFGRVKVWTEGRSGGHLVVEGLDPVENWDAIALGRWAKFAKFARAVADGIPYQVVSLIATNDFAAWQDEQDALAAEDAAAALPILAGV